MDRSGRILRWAAIMLAAAFALASRDADAGGITHGNKTFTFSLPAFSSSTPITPVANQSVHVGAVDTTTSSDRGVCQLELLRNPGGFLEWVGQGSPGQLGHTVSGIAGSPGSFMVCVSFDCKVRLEVNNTDSFLVRNIDVITHTGNVTLSW